MSESEPISVVVVDDHDLLREGVGAILAGFDDIDVVGEASSGEGALELVGSLSPDVVVIDVVMPGMGGIEAIRRLRQANSTLGIVALSSFSDGDRVREAVEAGANGYMVKSVDADSLARAVRSARAGQGAFSPEVTEALTARPTPSAEALASLTVRETEVAELVSEGKTNAEIANMLDLSIFTVKNHVSNVLMKLHVQSRTEAAAFILTARRA
jgi:NarL family two-component system response regulator LiaR